MKLKLSYLFFVAIALIASNTVSAQITTADRNRSIEVTGSAEINVKPDELEIEFTLKEYLYINKGAKEKFTLAAAEKEFFAILSNYGLKEKDIILDNSSLYWSNWQSWWNSRREDLKLKKLVVKIDSSINLLNLIKDVSRNWLNDVSITKMKNKNEQNFRKEVKIQAIKAAKEKAIYLLAAIDEAIGRVISVEEINEVNNYSYNYASNNYLSNSVNTSSTASSNDAGVNNTNLIKLRYEVKVVFEIK